MERWTASVALLQDWLDSWGALLSRLSPEAALALLLLPIVLTFFFRNAALSVGCILLAAGLIVVAPGKSTVVLGPALYRYRAFFARGYRCASEIEKVARSTCDFANRGQLPEQRRKKEAPAGYSNPRSKKINKRVGIRPLRSSVRWRSSLSESVQHMWDGKSDG
jgi:hypothetical protein